MRSGQRATITSSLRSVLRALREEVLSDHVQMVAAGLTFYAVFGLLPGLAAAAALWAQFGDIGVLQQSVENGSHLIPQGTRSVLEQFVTSVPEGFGVGLGLLLNLGLVVLTCYRAASGLLTALNIVYDITERRGRLRRAVVCLVVGVSGIALLFVALALFALPPALVQRHLQLGRALLWLRWPVLALVFTGGLGVLFRFAVSREPGQWWSAAVGAVVATVVWIAASYGVTVYAGFAGSFGQLYGSLGAVVVALLWFYASALAVLAGAEVDAVLADQASGRRPSALKSELRRRERSDGT